MVQSELDTCGVAWQSSGAESVVFSIPYRGLPAPAASAGAPSGGMTAEVAGEPLGSPSLLPAFPLDPQVQVILRIVSPDVAGAGAGVRDLASTYLVEADVSHPALQHVRSVVTVDRLWQQAPLRLTKYRAPSDQAVSSTVHLVEGRAADTVTLRYMRGSACMHDSGGSYQFLL